MLRSFLVTRGQVLTEHALQPHKTADVAVKVDVEVFVRVAHCYDVIQLLVEVKPFVWRERKRSSRLMAERWGAKLNILGAMKPSNDSCRAAHLHH